MSDSQTEKADTVRYIPSIHRTDTLAPGGGLPHFRYPDITEEAIRLRAYQLWEEAGQPSGQSEQLWRQAERELRSDIANRKPR